MFLINPLQYWYIILALTAFQIIIMLLWGWLLKIFVIRKYTTWGFLHNPSKRYISE